MNRTDTDRQTTLLDLSRQWRKFEDDLDAAVRVIVETATDVLDIERASVWFLSEDRESIVCRDVFERSAGRHSRGTILHSTDHPAYFDALKTEELIVAADAKRDPRTTHFNADYTGPLGIGAMLDAPIRFGGRTVGVLCHEHAGGPREFTTSEQSSAAFLANLLSLACEFQETTHNVSLLRAAFEATGAGILAVNKSGSVSHYNQEFLDLWDMPEKLMGRIGDGGPRVQHIMNQGAEQARMAQRWLEVASDPAMRLIEVSEMQDGRSIECRSLPQYVDGEIVGRVWSFRDVTYQRELEQELRNLSMHDGLTGLFNRRCAEEHLNNEIQRANRSKQPLSVALLDVDGFKKLNDLHGHAVGDQVLRELADDFRKRLRSTDLACRWGGEEFLIILPDTDEAGARSVVDGLRRLISRERRDIPSFTFSAGVAQYQDHSADQLVDLADTRMYQAKQSGRNRVC